MKIGVVDVGGGLRGIYAAGIFDYCLDNDIKLQVLRRVLIQKIIYESY